MVTQIQKTTKFTTSEVVSAVVKSSENNIQTNLIMVNPENKKENIQVTTITDKKTGNVTVISTNVVQTTAPTVLETIITSVSMEQSIKKSPTLQTVIQTITTVNTELTGVTPTQIINDVFGSKTISQVTYQNQGILTTVVTDETTGKTQVVSVDKIPQQIKPLIIEKKVNKEETTIINTNSVEEATREIPNFEAILEQMKMEVPSIMTQKITGIRVEKPKDAT